MAFSLLAHTLWPYFRHCSPVSSHQLISAPSSLARLAIFGILLLKPILNALRSLLIGLTDWLLRRKTPPHQILPYRSDWHFYTVLALDQLLCRLTSPQRKRHLQLIGCPILYCLLNCRLLLCTKRSLLPCPATSLSLDIPGIPSRSYRLYLDRPWGEASVPTRLSRHMACHAFVTSRPTAESDAVHPD